MDSEVESGLANLPEVIERIKDSLVQVYHPEAIYLFGSYAWGTPDKHSDIDVAVILDSSDLTLPERIRQSSDILWGIGIPVDILVYTREEIENRAAFRSTLQYKILHEGMKIYEAV